MVLDESMNPINLLSPLWCPRQLKLPVDMRFSPRNREYPPQIREYPPQIRKYPPRIRKYPHPNRAVPARAAGPYPLRVYPGAGKGPESRGSGGFTRICEMLDVVEVRTVSLLPALPALTTIRWSGSSEAISRGRA